MKSEDEKGRLKFTKGFQQPKHAEFIYMYFQLLLPIDFAELDTGCAIIVAHCEILYAMGILLGLIQILSDFGVLC